MPQYAHRVLPLDVAIISLDDNASSALESHMTNISLADTLANQKDLSGIVLLWLYRKESLPNIGFFISLVLAITFPILGWNQVLNDNIDAPDLWFSRSGSISCLMGIFAEILMAKHSNYSRRLDLIEMQRDYKIGIRNWMQVVDAKLSCLLENKPYTGGINVLLPAYHQVVYGRNMAKLRKIIPVVNTTLNVVGLLVVAGATAIWGYGDILYRMMR